MVLVLVKIYLLKRSQNSYNPPMTEVPLSNELIIKDIKEEANPAYELTKE